MSSFSCLSVEYCNKFTGNEIDEICVVSSPLTSTEYHLLVFQAKCSCTYDKVLLVVTKYDND